jgi:hypothetical protein
VIGDSFGSDTDNFNVPDTRGVFTKGAGTTDRAAGKDASGNYYAGTLGVYVQDQMQGHVHPAVGSVSGGGNLGAANFEGPMDSSTSGPSNDGVNGTPRTGHTTEPQSLSLTHIIKYE